MGISSGLGILLHSRALNRGHADVRRILHQVTRITGAVIGVLLARMAPQWLVNAPACPWAAR